MDGDWVAMLLAAFAVLAAGIWAAAFLLKPQRSVEQRPLDRAARLALVATAVFVLGTISWRSRSLSELNESPVDAAGAIRIVADLVAFSLAVLSMWSHQSGKRLPTGGWLYFLYIVVVLLGTVTAVDPKIVVFRAFELGVCLTVALAAYWSCDLAQILRFWRGAILVMVACVIGSALAVPSVGFNYSPVGIVPFRLEGVFPAFSANSVGFFGTLLIVFALSPARVQKWTLALGLALVALSQYRTGYVSVAVIFLVFFVVRGDALRRLVLVVALPPLAYLLTQSAVAGEAWDRGESGVSVQTLSGRTTFWAEAFEVAQRSPIIGTGLSSGTRNEVLAPLGYGSISTIHGTWIEAYVGAGILGVLALGTFVVAATRRSWQIRSVAMAPLLVVTVVAVRSLTGTSIELASIGALIFLNFALAAERAARERQPLRASTGGAAASGRPELRAGR